MKRIKNLLVLLGMLSSNLFAQDDFIPPSNFEYNQSRLQSFYLFINADIDGVGLEEGDKNNDRTTATTLPPYARC